MPKKLKKIEIIPVENIIEEFKPDYVYHFAGLVSIYDCNEDPYEAVDNNILGSINVMNGCLKADVKRIIFSETSAVYENCEMPEAGFNETQSDPTTVYWLNLIIEPKD